MSIRTPDLIVVPVVSPTLDEIRFWLRIMKEHVLFIKLGLPHDQTVLMAEADRLFALFAALEMDSMGVVPITLPDYMSRVRIAVEEVWAYKRHVLHLMLTGTIIGGSNYPLLLDHISREAAYFLKVLEKLENGQCDAPMDSIVQENVFWLRIMADHAKFIRGYLDPSERKLFGTINDFQHEFEMLLAQARDLESMLWDFQPVNDLRRFERDVEDATIRLRNFKAKAEELIENTAVLSLIHPLLADHVRREAEKFLSVLEVINQMICQAP
jgi:hypothetical protein